MPLINLLFSLKNDLHEISKREQCVHCLCAWASNDGRIWRMYHHLNISVWEQRQLITIRIYSVDNWCLSFPFALCPRIFVPNWANGVFRMAVHAFAKCDPLIISSWSPIWPFLPAARNKILSTHFQSFSQVAKHHVSICSCASHQTIIAVSSHKIYSVYNLIRKWKGRKKVIIVNGNGKKITWRYEWLKGHFGNAVKASTSCEVLSRRNLVA